MKKKIKKKIWRWGGGVGSGQSKKGEVWSLMNCGGSTPLLRWRDFDSRWTSPQDADTCPTAESDWMLTPKH